MKKIADINLYGFILLFQILLKKFKGFHFNETYTDQGYFQISAVPYDEVGNGEVVLEVFDPAHTNEVQGSFVNADISSKKITIGFFVFSFNTFRYLIDKKHLDDAFIITEIKKIIGLTVHFRDNSKNSGRDVEKWVEKTITNSPLNKYLQRVK
ncbi:MAG: hypothetical protein KBC98_01035 [Candidatus Pacebacteria bacterium]|nr:hypothetical protein [Candidatus Paceibacterota bacterium]